MSDERNWKRNERKVTSAGKLGRILLTIVLPWITPSSPAQEDSHSYNFRWYQTDSGLPEGEVMAMVQTPDGYLWCATFNGLGRFDGARFVTFDPSNTPELPTDRLSALDVTDSGDLIIKTEFGDIVVYSGGRFSRRGSAKYSRVEEDDAGRLWKENPGKDVLAWSPLGHDGQGGITGRLSGPWILGGRTFYEIDGGVLRRADNPSGKWETVALPLPKEETIKQLFTVKNGLWLWAQTNFYYFDGQSITRTVKRPAGEKSFSGVLQEDDGTVWLVGYHTHLFRVDPRENVAREVMNLPGRNSTYTMSALLDRERNVWMAVSGRGLLEVQAAAMRTFGEQDGLLNDIVRTVAEDDGGNLWVCTTKGINVLSKQGIVSLPLELQTHFAWMACPSTTPGKMWVATYSDGLFAYTKENRRVVKEINCSGWGPPYFTFLFKDSKGLLWFGNSSGLFSFDGTNTTAAALPGNRPPDVRALAEAKDGAMYAGCNGQGLFVRDKSTKVWRQFTRKDGLESEQIYSLHVDPTGTLWIGASGAGLARFDGKKFIFFKKRLSQLPRTVTGIEDDGLGYLWLGSTRGIFRIKLSDLNATVDDPNHAVALTEFGRNSGLLRTESVVGLQPSATKGKDGRIWFATTGGVVCFDPTNITVNHLAPPVAIESVTSGDCRLDLTAAPMGTNGGKAPLRRLSESKRRTVTAQAGADPIEFEYTGLSFTAPENVRFRYRMEGLDEQWTRTSDRKAVYQRLPPGSYTFHVSACNNDGVWNDAGAELAMVQLPYYWETAWFRIAVVAAAAGIIYGAYRYRLAQLARVGRLRAQIAADLHDEVGSNMGAVVLNSDLLTMSPNLSTSEREQVADIHRVARNTAHAIREISWFINPDFDSLDEMIARMKEAAGRLSRNHDIQFSAPEDAPKTRLQLEFRRNVMAIYKEALNNAARHSGAKRIEVAIRIDSGRMELLVWDNGRGFTANQDNGGQGLRNLRQRATAVRGELEINTKPGDGTMIRFRAVIR